MSYLGWFAIAMLGGVVVCAMDGEGSEPGSRRGEEADEFVSALDRQDHKRAKELMRQAYGQWKGSDRQHPADDRQREAAYQRLKEMSETLRNGDPLNEALCGELAALALRDADDLPIEDEAWFVDALLPDPDILTRAEFTNARRNAARACCHYLVRLRAEAEASAKRPAVRVLPEPVPPAELGALGASPAGISDPAQRAAYARALHEHARSMRESIRSYEQRETLRSLQNAADGLETTLADMYRAAPSAGTELMDLLRQYRVDAETTGRISRRLNDTPQTQ